MLGNAEVSGAVILLRCIMLTESPMNIVDAVSVYLV